MRSPRVYATFLLWLLTELFEKLPEVGDPDKPKLVFFFDEAHLLFSDLPPVVADKVTQIVRLIRSKGVGVYFVSQNPLDIPEAVLGQLGNRVQHALRAFTPKDQKAVKAAAQTFRANPKLDVEKTISELEVGEALVSFLDEKGTPGMVERALVCPPRGQIGPITPEQRAELMKTSLVAGVYENAVDRESAYETAEGTRGTAGSCGSTAAARATISRGTPTCLILDCPANPAAEGAAATASSKPCRRARPALSAAASVARSCAACWVRCWEAQVNASGIARVFAIATWPRPVVRS